MTWSTPARRGAAARRFVLVVAAVVLIGAVSAAVWRLSGPAEPPAASRDRAAPAEEPVVAAYVPPSVEGYVGNEACSRCHAEIVESYETHPMSRSITRVDEHAADASVSPAESRIAGERHVYDVEVRDGAMVHHARMFDAAGEQIFDDAHPIEWVVGSGQRAKSYLIQRGDLLFMSPLTWYSESHRWDMSPGYTPEDPRRFSRRVQDDCLACHAGRVKPVGHALNKFGNPAVHASIGCENCHGPGERHAALHETGESASAGGDPIVNPARLDTDRRESVCYQCHLEAAARVLRPGRSHLDFRPGQRLDEIWTVLDESSDAAGGRAPLVHHVQQMRASLCYTSSEGGLGCISCHDPHRLPAEEEKLTFYRQKCFTCHDDGSCSAPHDHRAAREDSCVACHMPRRQASNVAHVTQTDHRVVRTPDRSSEEETHTQPGTLEFFDHADQRLSNWERGRAAGLGAWIHLVRQGQPLSPSLAVFLDGLLKEEPKDGALLIAAGWTALRLGDFRLARTYFEPASEIPAAEERALSGLLDIYFEGAQWPRALECADRLIEIDPWNARTHAIRGRVLTRLGRAEEAIRSSEKALDLNPTLIEVREELVAAYARSGRVEDQRREEEAVARMRTAKPPAP